MGNFSRNDAGLAAAELALAVEKHVVESGYMDTVGKVGILELHPGAINSIPSKAYVEIVMKAMESATQVLNLSYKKMISRAYHDSLFMAGCSQEGKGLYPKI